MYRSQNFSNDPHNFTNLTIEECKGLILSKFVSILLNLFWIKCEFKYCTMFMFPIIGEGWIPCRYIFCWTRQLWSQVLNNHCLGSIYFYPYLWIRIISGIRIKGTKISVSVDTDIFSDPDPGNKNIRICGYAYFLGSGSRERKCPATLRFKIMNLW